jgi:hypothetical protein
MTNTKSNKIRNRRQPRSINDQNLAKIRFIGVRTKNYPRPSADSPTQKEEKSGQLQHISLDHKTEQVLLMKYRKRTQTRKKKQIAICRYGTLQRVRIKSLIVIRRRSRRWASSIWTSLYETLNSGKLQIPKYRYATLRRVRIKSLIAIRRRPCRWASSLWTILYETLSPGRQGWPKFHSGSTFWELYTRFRRNGAFYDVIGL